MESSESGVKSVILSNLDNVMGSANRILEELYPNSPIRKGEDDTDHEWIPSSSSSDNNESSSDEYLPPQSTAVIQQRTPTTAQHECGKCEKVFSTRKQLLGHMRGVHVLPKYQCEDCQVMFKKKSHLKKHKERRPKHCRIASYRKRLIANQDTNKDSQENVARILKRMPNYTCYRCNRVFTRNEHLQGHLSRQPSLCLETEKVLQKQRENDEKKNNEKAERAPSIDQPEANKPEEYQTTTPHNDEENSQKVESDTEQQVQQLKGMVKSCLTEILHLRKRMRTLEKQVTALRKQEKT